MEEPPNLDPDPFSHSALRSVELADRATIDPFFASLEHPLSDFTFSQLYTWRNSLRIAWTTLHNHLCVFANGSGDLTLLLPPIGDTGSDKALDAAHQLMDDYNTPRGVTDHARVEYVSDELLQRFDTTRFHPTPMGMDYVYDAGRMIDLAGGDLKSKRQEKNRFMRLYENRYRVETYDASRHLDGCTALLQDWKIHQDANHIEEGNTNARKRQQETTATALTLRAAPELGLRGLVIYVTDDTGHEAVRGFTFGEPLGRTQSSILIEKTDLQVRGLAQFIFSEFVARFWSDRPLVNVGDDWGLETLAWTKASYRPVKLLQKYTMRRVASVVSEAVPTASGEKGDGHLPNAIAAQACDVSGVGVEGNPSLQLSSVENGESSFLGETRHRFTGDAERPVFLRGARRDDLVPALDLEQRCFSAFRLSKRQLAYLQRCPNAVFVVAEQDAKVRGSGIALVRQHRRGTVSGRVYSLAVDPESRGRGIGRQLLQRLLEDLSARGVRRVYLEAEITNVTAIRLYERLGFRSIGHLPDYYGPGLHGVHMMYEAVVALAA